MPRKVEFQINMADGTKKTVLGIVVNNRWGIDKREVETVKHTKDGDKVTLSHFFVLTYIPNGALVTSANTQKALMELVNREDMIEQDDIAKIANAVSEFWNERGWKG